MSVLSIGQSALAAAQLGLTTTSNNIANASTPGYNEEQIVQTEGGGQETGSGFIGSGAQVQTVTRSYNSFLTTEVNTAQASYSSLNTNYTQISQINNMLATSTTGLSPSIQSFFNSVQSATTDPSAAASLETVLTSAQTLASEFQSTAGQLSQIAQGVNTQLSSTVQTINSYATQIASLNQSIQTAEATTPNQPPNDLLDERDEAVAELSKQVGVTVVTQGTAYNISIGTGQPLVVGTQAYQLTTMESPTNASQLEVGYVTGSTTSEIPESSLTGGAVGGLLQFRSQSLTPAQNALGQMAAGLASAVNNQQELGVDQNGNTGAAMFTLASPVVGADTNNTGNLQVGATITDAGALTADNYSLTFDGTNYNLTDTTTNALVYQGTTFPPPSTNPGVPSGAPDGTIDGLTFSSTGGAANAGDSYLIQPTVNAASGLNVAITNVSQIAMAAPIVTNTPNTNTGTGTISAGVVNSPAPVDPNLTDSVSITFNGAPNAGTYNVTDTTTGTQLDSDVTYAAGSNISYNGWTVQITGAPAAGDTFTVGKNTSASGDSRNGVLMAKLQTTETMNNGTTSIQGAYAQLVSSVGNQTANLEATSTSANTQLTNATSAQQSVSGVNLDEEASNLIRYQQAYQAAAQVMSTANTLFTTLLTDLSAAG